MSFVSGDTGSRAGLSHDSGCWGSSYSAEQLRDIIQYSPAAIVSFDRDLRVVAYNREAVRLFGPLPPATENPLAWLVPARLLDDHLARFDRILAGESLSDVVVSMNLGGDAPTSVQVSAAPLRDAEGRVTGGVVIALDVTERVRLERELRESEARYARFVETATEGILSIDTNRVITFANRAMAAMIGYELVDIVGESFDHFVAPGDLADHVARMAERRAGKAGRYVRRFVRRDGSECVCSVSAIPLFDDRGRFVGSFGMFTDITEQVEAERIRHERETQYRLVVETAIDGYLLVDTDERIIDVNEAYLRSSGYTREEILGMRINDLDALESPEETRSRTDAIMRDGSAIFESMHRAKDGRVWPVEVNTVYQTTGKGRLVAFIRDLQRRRRSELLLRTRMELSTLALTGTLDELMTAAIDAAELFTGSRIGFFHFVEEDQENLTLQTWSTNTLTRMCTAEAKGAHYPISQAGVWVECCATRAPVIHNDYASLPNKKGLPEGHAEVVRELVVPVMREDRIVAILGVGNKTSDYDAGDIETVDVIASLTLDLIERKRAEDMRRAADERYRTLVDNLDEMVLATDARGIVTFVSNASERLGYRPEEMIGRRVDEFVHPDDRETASEALLGTLEGRTCSGEFRILTADENVRIMRISARPVMERGQLTGVTGFGIDVTEQRRTEEQLRAALKMEAVGRLAGGVAHDFNNVLTVIKSYTEMAMADLREDHPIQDDLREVHSAADRAAALTRQLLAFSRKQVLESVVVDVNELVVDMRRMLTRLIGEDIEIALRLGEDLWPVKADAGQLEQVVMNLAVNARDAMPRGGRLVIETINENVVDRDDVAGDGVPPGDYVTLSVADNGIGMTPDVAARVFEPFFTTKETGKGTGLGLATVYGIVTQSGGHISVESTPGQGTTFRIRLPRTHDATPAMQAREEPLPTVRGHETILLVEDEESVRRLVGRILTNAGYRVIEAANGDDALRTAELMRCEIPLVVSDVVMPGTHGHELEDRLRALCPNVRILFMSGYDQDEVAVRVSERPRTEFMQKPFQKSELLEKVRRTLDQKYPCLVDPMRTSCPDKPHRTR